ncbi:hypothetical protein KIN20_018906 [Parelaphostrongylus tenuis]|uniref:Uncharacterized protein n=1 Tax=Parelaphostrongylus tenuis TaxID=148309 RepID=A0AAD5N489_PARTN|nr:hypothetical protein KIN20_018906 [Parelaphostrongylus tenuis]
MSKIYKDAEKPFHGIPNAQIRQKKLNAGTPQPASSCREVGGEINKIVVNATNVEHVVQGQRLVSITLSTTSTPKVLNEASPLHNKPKEWKELVLLEGRKKKTLITMKLKRLAARLGFAFMFKIEVCALNLDHYFTADISTTALSSAQLRKR